MSNINIDITSSGNFQAFSQLDAEQRKAVTEAMRLSAAMKQAEAASTSYAETAVRSHARVSQAAMRADQDMRRLATEQARTTELRYGSEFVLPQAHRQIVRQIFASGQDPAAMSGYTQELFATAQQTMAARKALADQLRARRQQEVADAELTRRSNDFFAPLGDRGNLPPGAFSQPWRVAHESMIKDMQGEGDKYFAGDALNAFVSRGGKLEGESVFMQRARRVLADRLSGVEGSIGKMTEDQLTVAAQGIASSMEKSAAAALSTLTTVGTVAAIGAYASFRVGQNSKDRWDAAADRLTANAHDRRTLRQVADSPYDFRHLISEAEGFQNMLGMGQESYSTVFAMKSAGLDDAAGRQIVKDAFGVGADPATALQAVQKIKANFPKSGNAAALFSKLLLASQGTPSHVDDLAEGVGTMAAAWRSMGGDEGDKGVNESLAVLAGLSVAGRSTETGATELRALSSELAKKRGQILFGNDAPLGGLDLMRSLGRLAAENRLTNEKGRAVSVEGFLGESRAITGWQQIKNQLPMIDTTLATLNRNSGNAASTRAIWGDRQTDAATAMNSALNQQQNVENDLFGVPASIAKGMFAAEMAKDESAGWTNPWYMQMRTTLNDLKDNPVANPGGYITAMKNAVSSGHWGNDDLLMQYFRWQYQTTDTGTLQSMLKEKSATMPKRYGKNWALQNMTPEEFGARQETIQRELDDRLTRSQQGPGVGANSTGDDLIDSLLQRRQILSPAALKMISPGLEPALQSADYRLTEWERSSGYTPDDYHTTVMENLVGNARRRATIGYEKMIKAGRRPEDAQAFAQWQFNTVPDDYDEGAWKADNEHITAAIAAQQAKVKAAKTPEARIGLQQQLEMMQNTFYTARARDSGTLSFGDAHALATNPLFGGQGQADKLESTISKVIAPLEKIAGALSGPAQAGGKFNGRGTQLLNIGGWGGGGGARSAP